MHFAGSRSAAKRRRFIAVYATLSLFVPQGRHSAFISIAESPLNSKVPAWSVHLHLALMTHAFMGGSGYSIG